MDKEIKEVGKSLTEYAALFSKALQVVDEKIKPYVEALHEAEKRFRQDYGPIIIKFSEMIESKASEVLGHAKRWQEGQRLSVIALSEQGWFPNWFTFFYHPEEDFETIDDLMIAHIDDCWEDLKEKIIELSPKRKHILEVAFKLHEEGNYIASIPLLLSQSDGICSEEFTHFFSRDSTTGNRASDEIIKQAENSELAIDFLSEILLEPFKVNLQMMKGSSSRSASAKSKGPNRHGIIHGSRGHLDYGSKINGYKTISFLAFIVYTVKDEFKDE